MKGVIYKRVSDNDQIEGTSLQHQEESCRRYCADKGIEVVEVFSEEGESAKDLKLNNRQELLRALEFCRKHKDKIQAFVVLKVDRFARNTDDHFVIRKLLLDYGTTLHSVTEPIGNKPAEKFVETVLAATAEFDNAIRTQRSCDGMSQRIKNGIFPWKSPIGYLCQHAKKRDEKKTKPDAPDPKIFPLIQRALKEYAKGTYSQVELARLLDVWGLKTIRGKKTTAQLIDNILGKYLKFYAGILENPWEERREYVGLHVPMISREEMYTIKLIRSGKANLIKRDKFNPMFSLRRTVICSDCGRPYTASSPRGNGGKYAYYHCQNKMCSQYGKSIPKLELEKEFIKYLKKITPKEKFLTAFNETVIDLWKEKGHTFELEAKKQANNLIDLGLQKKNIHEFLENGTYTQEIFKERIGEIENRIAATKISFNEAKIEQFDIEAVVIYATKFMSDLGRQWFDLSPQLRPRFQKLVFPEGLPYSKINGFGTAKLGLIYEINRQSHGNLSSMVCLLYQARTYFQNK